MKHLQKFENYLKDFFIDKNKYWFEVRDPKDEKGYSVGWGVGNIGDDNISKFNRTDRYEQFKVFAEVKKLFIEWFKNNNPSTFYFSVPGEKRMNIYIKFIMELLGNKYKYVIEKTDYKPFDLKEKNVYYVVFNKVNTEVQKFEAFANLFGLISYKQEEKIKNIMKYTFHNDFSISSVVNQLIEIVGDIKLLERYAESQTSSMTNINDNDEFDFWVSVDEEIQKRLNHI